jgi:hypothetical protein
VCVCVCVCVWKHNTELGFKEVECEDMNLIQQTLVNTTMNLPSQRFVLTFLLVQIKLQNC